jgi:hypothetical protein
MAEGVAASVLAYFAVSVAPAASRALWDAMRLVGTTETIGWPLINAPSALLLIAVLTSIGIDYAIMAQAVGKMAVSTFYIVSVTVSVGICTGLTIGLFAHHSLAEQMTFLGLMLRSNMLTGLLIFVTSCSWVALILRKRAMVV